MAFFARLVLASLLMALLVLSVHADDAKFDTPENAAKTFLQAMSKQDNAAMLRCLIESERESCKDDFSGPPVEGLTISSEIKTTSTKGKTATVACVLSMALGENSEASNFMLVLSLEKDQWRLCWQASVRATNLEFPEQRRRQHAENAKLILIAIKDKARVVTIKQGRNPKLVSELGFSEQDLAEPYWVMKNALRLSKDGSSAIAEIESREYDDLVLIRFGIEYKKKDFTLLGIEDKSSPEDRAKEAERLLGAIRDNVKARCEAGNGVIPGEVLKEGGSLTAFDLVSDHWVVRNEVTSQGKLVSLKADSLAECKIATLEFDASTGGGTVKFNEAYTKADLASSEKARIDIVEIRKALESYKRKNGVYPDSLEGIKGQLGGKLPTDPFSNLSYSYEKVASNGTATQCFKLGCLGRDGKEGGRWVPDKDIVFTIEHTPKSKDEGAGKDR